MDHTDPRLCSDPALDRVTSLGVACVALGDLVAWEILIGGDLPHAWVEGRVAGTSG